MDAKLLPWYFVFGWQAFILSFLVPQIIEYIYAGKAPDIKQDKEENSCQLESVGESLLCNSKPTPKNNAAMNWIEERIRVILIFLKIWFSRLQP